MRQSRLNVFSVLAVLSVILLLSAAPDAPAGPQWEYGIYEVVEQTTGRLQRTLRWQTKDEVVTAEEDKFRLFRKLDIYCTQETAHDLMLWNRLGSEGWEFVEHYAVSTLQNDRKVTIFRRPRK